MDAVVIKATNEEFQTITKEPAFLVATLLDPAMSNEARARQVQDTLMELLPNLQAVGAMWPYERKDGTFGLSQNRGERRRINR
jgi:hypothetical protein